jgi:hypothetical protein
VGRRFGIGTGHPERLDGSVELVRMGQASFCAPPIEQDERQLRPVVADIQMDPCTIALREAERVKSMRRLLPFHRLRPEDLHATRFRVTRLGPADRGHRKRCGLLPAGETRMGRDASESHAVYPSAVGETFTSDGDLWVKEPQPGCCLEFYAVGQGLRQA